MEVWVHYCDGSQLDTDEWGFGKMLAFSQFLKTLILSFSGSEDWISFNNLQSSSSWESCLISSAQLKKDVGFIYRLLHSQSLRCKVQSADKNPAKVMNSVKISVHIMELVLIQINNCNLYVSTSHFLLSF